MTGSGGEGGSIMAALEQFEATEANLGKLERLWEEMSQMIPSGIVFGSNHEYEDRERSFGLLLASLPRVEGWRPTAAPPGLDAIAQNRFDALEVGEPGAEQSVESWIEEPGAELREYRFRFNNMRRALIREPLVGLIDQIDADIRTVREAAGSDSPPGLQFGPEVWMPMKEHLKQIEVLLGSSVPKPARWSDMLRHMHFGYEGDLRDIEKLDWPDVKATLRRSLYGVNEAVPVTAKDLAALVAAHPKGPITTALAWTNLDDEAFERLVFTFISDTPGYENPEWLMQTRAPDRGRDLSVTRVTQDGLSGTLRQRVVIQCKHWVKRSVSLTDASATKDQMSLWTSPRVDVLIIATSGRSTADAVTWIENHNSASGPPRIEMWPESHLEMLLAARPAVIAEFKLRGN